MLQSIAFAFLIGGLVGIVGHVRKKGKIVKPRKTKKFIYLGFLEEVFMGALSAVLLVLSSEVDSLSKVIYISILAGIGGEAVLEELNGFRTVQRSEVHVDSSEKKID
jgi:hypothetical protein